MLKKLSKLLAIYRATRHGYGASPSKPWKRGKWKGPKHARHDASGYPPYGYGPGYGRYDHGRRRGFKGMIIDLIVRKLLKLR